MLSIEEIQLLIDKLEKIKKEDLQKLIDSNLKILKDLAIAVDANNQDEINRLDKTLDWFRMDLKTKREKLTNKLLIHMIEMKISQFAKTNMYNSLEIGPGNGMFHKSFLQWRLNYFLDVLPEIEGRIRKLFPPLHQKYLKFYLTDRTFKGMASSIPENSCNFVFSWDTFPFFTQEHIQQYLTDIKRVLIPGGYCFIHYTDCHFDYDLHEAKRGYWNYNTKDRMKKIIENTNYQIIEMEQFKPGANYAIFKKPGNQNPAMYKKDEITID